MAEKTIAAFQGGGRPPATDQDGCNVLEVLAACYLSADQGRRVSLDDPALAGYRFQPASS
jgi:hypothetical protein